MLTADNAAPTDAPPLESVRGLFTAAIAKGELELPVLPEVAARVVAVAGSKDTDSAVLARLITGDQSLAAHVMRIAKSAIYQPRNEINSLQAAISWLGAAEVADIAFTVAVQGRLLSLPGQKLRAQALWKQAVSTGHWARWVAEAVGCKADSSYLSGLLHQIGTPACLQVIGDLSRAAGVKLTDAETDALVTEFDETVGARLAAEWALPEEVVAVVAGWRRWAAATVSRDACAVVYLARQLADHMQANSGSLAADALLTDPVSAHFGLGLTEILGLCGRSDQVRAVVAGY
jgi:HD-like signal output (HDOD) protein